MKRRSKGIFTPSPFLLPFGERMVVRGSHQIRESNITLLGLEALTNRKV